MIFRKFKQSDSAFCYKIRSTAFIKIFYSEIGEYAVYKGIKAYLPKDFIKLWIGALKL